MSQNKRDGGAQADAVTVDGADDRLRAIEDVLHDAHAAGRLDHLALFKDVAAGAFQHALDIAAHRKVLARTLQQDGVDLLVTRQVGPDVLQLDMELVRDAVAGIGLVERDDGELAFLLDLQALVAGVVDGGFAGHDGLTVHGQALC